MKRTPLTPEEAAQAAADRLARKAPATRGTRRNPGVTDRAQIANDLASDLESGYLTATGTPPDDWKRKIDL